MVGWVVLALALVAFALNVVIPYLLSKLAIPFFEADAPLRPRTEPVDPDARQDWCVTADGVRLALAVWNEDASSSRPVVVFCPESGGDRWLAGHYAAGLIADGFPVVSFDFRGLGDSESTPGYEPTHWLSDREVTDLRGVLDWVAGQASLAGRRLGLFGVSRGAGAALYVAAVDGRSESIVADGAYSAHALTMRYLQKWGALSVPRWVIEYVPDWHLGLTMDFARLSSGRRHGCRYPDLARVLPRLRGRAVRLIAGRRDSYIPREVTDVVAKACGTVDLHVVPKARHNGARDVDPEAYDRLVVEAFAAAERFSAGEVVSASRL